MRWFYRRCIRMKEVGTSGVKPAVRNMARCSCALIGDLAAFEGGRFACFRDALLIVGVIDRPDFGTVPEINQIVFDLLASAIRFDFFFNFCLGFGERYTSGIRALDHADDMISICIMNDLA